jgi:uncharacterized protein
VPPEALADLVAIDVHTHVLASVEGQTLATESAQTALDQVFGEFSRMTVPELAAYYRERNMICVTFMVDQASVAAEASPVTNEEIATLAREYADVVIPFASVDPARGAEGVRMARRLIKEYGVRGFKFHPSLQQFFPNDRDAYPLYEVIAFLRCSTPATLRSGPGSPGEAGSA